MILQLFAIEDDKLVGFSFNHADQVDELGKATGAFATVQGFFDSRAEELRLKHNALIDTFIALTGSAQIGHTSASVVAETVAAALEEIKLLADSNESRITAEEGALTTHKSSADHDGRYFTETELTSQTDGSSGMDIVGMTPIDGVMTTPQQSLEYLKATKTDLIGNHLGAWQGFDSPTASDPGIQNQVDANTLEISNIKYEDTENFIKIKKISNLLASQISSLKFVLLGDSTGNENTEWFYKTMQWFGTNFPYYSVRQRRWNDSKLAYDGTEELQTGSLGDAYATLPGASGAYVSTPDSAALSITGDMEIRAKLAMDDWVVGSGSQVICSKFGASSTRGWSFYIDGASGKPIFQWSADGSTLITAIATVAPTVLDGDDLFFKVNIDVDNGAGGNDVKFYTLIAGSWVQLGATITTAGVTSIFNNAVAVEIGGRNDGGIGTWAGKFYYLEIRNGIEGTVVASADFDLAFPDSITSFKDTSLNTWTINGSGITVGNGSPGIILLNGSTPGAALSYSVTNFTKQLPLASDYVFISYSHNEGLKTEYTDEYQALIDLILANYPKTAIVAVTQNPQISPRTSGEISAHATRNTQIKALAKAGNYGLINNFDAVTNTELVSDLTNPDGVHPVTSGTNVWVNEAKRYLKESIF